MCVSTSSFASKVSVSSIANTEKAIKFLKKFSEFEMNGDNYKYLFKKSIPAIDLLLELGFIVKHDSGHLYISELGKSIILNDFQMPEVEFDNKDIASHLEMEERCMKYIDTSSEFGKKLYDIRQAKNEISRLVLKGITAGSQWDSQMRRLIGHYCTSAIACFFRYGRWT
jgi:hypothetical protein